MNRHADPIEARLVADNAIFYAIVQALFALMRSSRDKRRLSETMLEDAVSVLNQNAQDLSPAAREEAKIRIKAFLEV